MFVKRRRKSFSFFTLKLFSNKTVPQSFLEVLCFEISRHVSNILNSINSLVLDQKAPNLKLIKFFPSF